MYKVIIECEMSEEVFQKRDKIANSAMGVNFDSWAPREIRRCCENLKIKFKHLEIYKEACSPIKSGL